MKQHIKAAIVFKADVGHTIDTLREKLAEHQFEECQPYELRSSGFVPVSGNDNDPLVSEFKNGFAFRVRIDEKVIPGATVKRMVDDFAKGIKAREDRTPGKKERAEIKTQVIAKLAVHAIPRTAIITCFFQQTTGYLIVPTTSKKLADTITTRLIMAAGSIKTETIHVSDVKHGLTTRLQAWSEGVEEAFGVFEPCAEAALQQAERKITIKMGSLAAANTGIKEALAAQFQVTSLGFTHDGATEFRLTKDFRLKGIEFAHTDTEEDGDDEPSFYAQATLEVDAVSAVITDLVEMIGHGKEETEGVEPTGSQE